MANQYLTPEELLKRHSGRSRFSENQREIERRRNDTSAFNTGITIDAGELFFTIPNELSRLNEKVLRFERKISSTWRALPPIARGASIRSLIMDEIVSSNKIEGIRSTRRQIAAALASLNEEPLNNKQQGERKFREFASLYLNLTEQSQQFPKTPQDIRAIYDAVVADSLKKRDQPDGQFFRAESVDILDRFDRSIHTGIHPEEKIVSMIKDMLKLVDSEEIPEIYSAILAHFIFEYIHPFYDGNGRTGRYLLALYLSRPLSLPTVLSLSRTIAENTKPYYEAFGITEAKLNGAEGTFFILEIMRLIRIAQEELLSDLEEKTVLLTSAHERIFVPEEEPLRVSEKAKLLLYQFTQNSLFALLAGVTLEEMVEYLETSAQTARKYAQELCDRDLAVMISKRPLMFTLSAKGKELLGLSVSQ